jgi:hypothetical protein
MLAWATVVVATTVTSSGRFVLCSCLTILSSSDRCGCPGSSSSLRQHPAAGEPRTADIVVCLQLGVKADPNLRAGLTDGRNHIKIRKQCNGETLRTVRHPMRLWFLLMASGVTAFSQPFGFGVRAGVPLNDFVSTVQSPNFGFNSTTNRYIIGPMAELRLPFGLGVEVDALYRHFNFHGTTISPTGTLFTSANSGAWEFPVLAKFRFPSS